MAVPNVDRGRGEQHDGTRSEQRCGATAIDLKEPVVLLFLNVFRKLHNLAQIRRRIMP
jgi:hypothetical protein